MDFPVFTMLLCAAIGLWSIAGSLGALAQRLDREVRMHQLKVDVRKIQRQRRAPTLVLGPDFDIASTAGEWDYVEDSAYDGPGPVPLPHAKQRAA